MPSCDDLKEAALDQVGDDRLGDLGQGVLGHVVRLGLSADEQADQGGQRVAVFGRPEGGPVVGAAQGRPQHPDPGRVQQRLSHALHPARPVRLPGRRRLWQAGAMPKLYLATEPAADKLLAKEPLALLIGMLLDQQVPLEKAFMGPYDLRQRLGHDLDARELADYDTDALIAIFAQRPALHRFRKQKAQIFVALLAKQFRVRPEGWREAAGIFGEDGSYRSVADITDADSLVKVRSYKQQMKAATKAGG